jgi:hypothetical protein
MKKEDYLLISDLTKIRIVDGLIQSLAPLGSEHECDRAKSMMLGLLRAWECTLLEKIERVPTSGQAPLEVLRIRVPEYAAAEDEVYWYVAKSAWPSVCQGYNPERLAASLVEMGLLHIVDFNDPISGKEGAYAIRKDLGKKGEN